MFIYECPQKAGDSILRRQLLYKVKLFPLIVDEPKTVGIFKEQGG